jgi:DNA-directed RNA polymerase
MATNPVGSLRAKAVLADMQKWFETEIRSKAAPVEVQVLIIMVRATVHALEGTRMDRSIRRYAEIARGISDEVFEELLNSDEYDENEYMVVGRATSDYYEEEPLSDAELENTQNTAEDAILTLKAPIATGFVDLDSLPEVRPVATKSFGVNNIKSVMASLTGLPPLGADASPEARLERALERQIHLEQSAVDVAIERWRQEDEALRKLGIHSAIQTKPIGSLMWQWYTAMLPALQEEIKACAATMEAKKCVSKDREVYGPFMEILSAEKLAANTILTVMNSMMSGKKSASDEHSFELRVLNLTTAVANAVELEVSTQQSAERNTNKYSHWSSSKTRRMHEIAARRRLKTKLTTPGEAPSAVTSETELPEAEAHAEWPKAAKLKMGAMLISKLLECAKIPCTRVHPRTGEKVTQMQLAFAHRVKFTYGKKTGLIVPHDSLTEKLMSEPLGSLMCKRMPMVVQPKPWTGWESGGYLHYAVPILRVAGGDKTGREYFDATDREGDLSTLYKGLTALGKVPWHVNRDVFRVQLEAWNSGEAIANFPPLDPSLPIPREPEASLDPTPRKKWLMELREIEHKKSALHSQRSFQNLQLEMARSLLNETLYFPHNLDFRGRAYPISPYLNHMGADNVRALMTFAEGKELGPSGLRWLKIHVATVAGHDKASLDDRVAFTMQHLDDIYDSVRNPLGGRRWWLQAEDAWQTLAACFELTKALDSPDPEKYVSHLPMQQDGTCNGLQHYAALGGDEAGAKQVNLEPSDKPADVYTAVCDAVRAQVQEDADADHPIAKLINGRITRKCVKQPVMTNVYGVTFYGAKQQVMKQLDLMLPESGCPPGISRTSVADYVARKIFRSLGDMFTGAQAIQEWLGECADRISTALSSSQIQKAMMAEKQTPVVATAKRINAKRTRHAEAELKDLQDVPKLSPQGKSTKSKPFFKSTVVWTTPLGLPVVQPYRSTDTHIVATCLQGLTISEPQPWDPVNRRKQLQAFPPNFIHSLDSTHMLLSAIKFDELGKTFASVHDSFWTHACDVDTLNEVLRDAFISMHSDDVIARLREEFQARYQGCFHLKSVRLDSPAGKEISKLRRLGRKSKVTPMSGVHLELERVRLLNSDDPAEREQGAAMVTPASILSEFSCEVDGMRGPPEMQDQSLGRLPADATGLQVAREDDASSPASDAEILLDEEGDADDGVSGNLDAADSGSADESAGAAAEDDVSASPEVPRKRSEPKVIYAWVPLEFPPVPAKGTFDVTKIQQSKYFFH